MPAIGYEFLSFLYRGIYEVFYDIAIPTGTPKEFGPIKDHPHASDETRAQNKRLYKGQKISLVLLTLPLFFIMAAAVCLCVFCLAVGLPAGVLTNWTLNAIDWRAARRASAKADDKINKFIRDHR